MDATAFSSYPMSYPSYPTYGYPQAMPMAMPMAMPEGATREVATAPTPVYEAPQMTMPTMTTMPVMPSFYTVSDLQSPFITHTLAHARGICAGVACQRPRKQSVARAK